MGGDKHGPFYYLTQCLAAGKINKFLLKLPLQRQAAKRASNATINSRSSLRNSLKSTPNYCGERRTCPVIHIDFNQLSQFSFPYAKKRFDLFAAGGLFGDSRD